MACPERRSSEGSAQEEGCVPTATITGTRMYLSGKVLLHPAWRQSLAAVYCGGNQRTYGKWLHVTWLLIHEEPPLADMSLRTASPPIRVLENPPCCPRYQSQDQVIHTEPLALHNRPWSYPIHFPGCLGPHHTICLLCFKQAGLVLMSVPLLQCLPQKPVFQTKLPWIPIHGSPSTLIWCVFIAL